MKILVWATNTTKAIALEAYLETQALLKEQLIKQYGLSDIHKMHTENAS